VTALIAAAATTALFAAAVARLIHLADRDACRFANDTGDDRAE
jgi:hypothetical protein